MSVERCRVGTPTELIGGRMTGLQKRLAAATTVFLITVGPTYAATVTVGESYSITETGFTGNKPGITDDLSGNLTLTKNVWSSATNFSPRVRPDTAAFRVAIQR